MAGLAELEVEYKRLVVQREALAEAGDYAAAAKLTPRIAAIAKQIDALTQTSSSGQIVANDANSLKENSTTVNPSTNNNVLVLSNGRVKLPPESTAGGNALKIPPAQDSGTNDTLRPYIVTQSVPPGSNQISTGPVSEDRFIGGNAGSIAAGSTSGSRATPSGDAGAGAARDDKGSSKVNPVVSELNNIDYGSKIIPQPNILDQYASYTYQASLYLMNKTQYQTMVNTKRKDISGSQLLVQSGGASAGTGRNQFFSLDYYIDNIELTSHIVGKGVGLAHNVSDVRMTIVEPNGISFIKNLDSAVQQYVGGTQTFYENDGTSSVGPSTKKRNFTSQLYLLVIRFYGYDDQGNLVRGGVSKPDPTSDPNAFVEKWYPLALSNVKFKVQNKAVEYQIDATAVPYYINASAGRGTIPYNIELSGQTLKDLLAGPSTYSAGQNAVTAGSVPAQQVNVATQASVRAIDNAIAASSAPSKADAANTVKKTIRSGLMAALNEYQRDLVSSKIIEVPDEYEIEFAIDSLASAKVTNPGLNIGATSMSKPGTAADQKLGSKQSMDPNSRVQGATAGMQIVQFLDNLIRTSSYIKSQQLIKIDESTGKETTTGLNIQNTSWYKISFEATPKEWDNKRNDYAYKIKYIISPYKISQLNSPYFKPPLYNGSHKQYTYWFTGQNDSVLQYEENLNALYYQILSGTNLNNITSNALEMLKFQYQTRSGQTDQGAQGKVNEPGANAADQLYSPSDLGECNITIIGDPSWLQQGEAWAGLKKGDANYYKPFLSDGTINFDSQQILFEVGYNLPTDYNLSTGLIEPANGQINSVTQQDQNLRRQGITQTNKVYIATDVKSHFNKGKFTQDIKGSLMIYYPAKTAAEQNQRTTAQQAAPVNTPAPKPQPQRERSSVTNPAPSSSIAKGQEALLHPTFNGNLTDNQLMSTPVYTNARRAGKSGTEALALARAASQNGTNNYRGSILPGFVDTSNNQYIVKDR